MLTACEGGLNEEGKSGCYFRAVFLQALLLAGGVSLNPPPQPILQASGCPGEGQRALPKGLGPALLTIPTTVPGSL